MPRCRAHDWRPSMLESDALFCATCGRLFRFDAEPAVKVNAVKTRLVQEEINARRNRPE